MVWLPTSINAYCCPFVQLHPSNFTCHLYKLVNSFELVFIMLTSLLVGHLTSLPPFHEPEQWQCSCQMTHQSMDTDIWMMTKPGPAHQVPVSLISWPCSCRNGSKRQQPAGINPVLGFAHPNQCKHSARGVGLLGGTGAPRCSLLISVFCCPHTSTATGHMPC